jgi:glucosamine--fructose-6-phosphate aminotransferase (isomerizing)
MPQIRSRAVAIADDIGRTFPRVYLTGCGDSLDAGISAAPTWERLLGVPVVAVPAMTFSMSTVDMAPTGSLVVALSQSGKVSRVVEAIRAARARGLRTVTVSANPGSPLSAEPADATLLLPFEKLGPIPGTTSYVLGTAALFELGRALGAGEDAERLGEELDTLPDTAEAAAKVVWPVAEDHAATYSTETRCLTLGYGPGLAPARFTTRKFLETSQLVALTQETEEYAHDEYSMVDERCHVLEFAPSDRGLDRSVEIAGYLRRVGADVAVVTDEESAGRFLGDGLRLYALPSAASSLDPILQAIVGEILSVVVARRVGGSLYGMAERVHEEDGDPQIYESAIRVAANAG